MTLPRLVLIALAGIAAGVMLMVASRATVGALLAPPTAPAPIVRSAPPSMPTGHGGRALASDPTRLATAQEIIWPMLQMRLRVPADWVIRTLTATELDVRHPTTPSTFVVAHATPMPVGPTVGDYVQAHLGHAREQLEASHIEGYTTRSIGAVPGILTIEHRGETGARMVTWTGFQPAEVGSVSVTLIAGADAADFVRDETLFGAIVESARFD